MRKFVPFSIALTLLFSAGYGTEQSPYRILFHSDRDHHGQPGGPGMRYNQFQRAYDLFSINPDGTDLVKLTEAQRLDLWVFLAAERSPDGSKLLFMSFFETSGFSDDIVLLNSDGTVQVKLTDNKWRDSNPKWSPDGSKIAFLSDRDGGYGHEFGTRMARN